MAASDKCLAKTREIIAYFDRAQCVIENPADSRLWEWEVARGLLENSVVTSYCCFPGYSYRKNTRLASSFRLALPRCPGAGLCPAMVGKTHKEHSQKAGGGCQPRYKTTDELHAIPAGLVDDFCSSTAKCPSETSESFCLVIPARTANG